MYDGGTVCDDSFDITTGDWICRLMGYQSLISRQHGLRYEFQESYPIKLDDVNCEGRELPRCQYKTSHNCIHLEDITLSCNVRGKGRMEDTDFTLRCEGCLLYSLVAW